MEGGGWKDERWSRESKKKGGGEVEGCALVEVAGVYVKALLEEGLYAVYVAIGGGDDHVVLGVGGALF